MTDELTDHRRAHENAAAMDGHRSGPLRGIRVVDLTQALAGPFCTMLLADLGADVIKIESPSGDMPRFGGPFMREDSERHYGGYFGSVNRNKRGMVLDLKVAADKATLLELIDSADVLVENYRAGVMERLGLGWETLSARNPRLVYAAIRGFGDPRSGESPYQDWPAYDVVAQAMGGIVSITGTAEGEMVRTGPSIGDIYPATVAALGVTAAVHHAQVSGQGQFVDVGMYDAITALCETAVYRWSYAGINSRPTGNSHSQFAPFDIYPTLDGACALAAPTESHWALLCQVMGHPELIDDERTRDNRSRVANTGFVREVVSEWSAGLTNEQVLQTLAGRVPVGPVNDAPALFADPHLKARRMLVALDQPGSTRPGVFAGPPIHMSATPPSVYRRAPILGEHSEEIRAALEADHEWPTDPLDS